VSSARGRGRATRVVAPDGPWTSLRAEREHVLAWLLRSHRLLAADPELRRVGRFVDVFRGGSWDRPVDATRVSKWETTTTAPDHAAVRRYEEVLGLPENHLVAFADVLLRYTVPELRAAPLLVRPPLELGPRVQARLAATVLAAHEDAVIDGPAWDELTHFLAVTPGAVLLRPDSASVVAERLLQEMIVADGQAWQQRFEAFCRLLAHPTMGSAAIDACVQLGSDPSNQVFIETWGALDAAPDPSAGRHLVRQLQHPLNDRAFHGALLGCLRTSEQGRFSEQDTRSLLALLRPLVADPGARTADRYAARAVLRRLDPLGLRPVVARPPTAGMVAAQAVLARVDAALRAVDREERFGAVPFEDEMLPRVVQAALAAEVDDERLYLAMAVGASPYREVVAEVLEAQVQELHRLGLHTLLERVVSALRVIGGPAQSGVLVALAGDEAVPTDVRSAAAFSLGHVGAGADGGLLTLLDSQTSSWRARRDDASQEVLTGVVYSLGVARRLPVLREWQEHQIPDPLRRSVRWWLDRPAAVMASVDA
jgi:hypothetical protein